MSVARKKAAPADKAKSDAEGVPLDPVDTGEKPAKSAAKAKGKSGPREPAKAPSKAKKKSGSRSTKEAPAKVKAESKPQPPDKVVAKVEAEIEPLPPDKATAKVNAESEPSAPDEAPIEVKTKSQPSASDEVPTKVKAESQPSAPDEIPTRVEADTEPSAPDEIPTKVKAESQPQPLDEDPGQDRGQPDPQTSSGPDPSREDPFLASPPARRSRFDPVVNWLKGIPWPKPSWAKDLFRLRPSGLEILVILLIIVAAIMVATQLFSGSDQPQASPGALTKRAQRRLPPSLIQAINALERNTQADRRVISRLQGRLDSLKMQISNLKDLIKAGESASSKPPDTVSPSPTPAPPGAPGAVTPPRPAPPAARPAARPAAGSSRRLTDLEIRLDELSRQVKRLERLLRRSRRPR